VESYTVVYAANIYIYYSYYSITTHVFIPGLKRSFSANPSHRSLPFFLRTDSTDSPDCLVLLLRISIFLLFSFSVLHFLFVVSVR